MKKLLIFGAFMALVTLAGWFFFRHKHYLSSNPGQVNPTQARAELEQVRKYLPDNFNVLLAVRTAALLETKWVQDIDRSVPAFKAKRETSWKVGGDKVGLPPSDVAACYFARNMESDPFLVILTRKPVPAEQLLAAFDKDDYREVRVGGFTMYEMKGYPRATTFAEYMERAKEEPKFDGTGQAFCIVEPSIVVQGQAKDLKAVLERNRPVELSETFQKALRSVDFSQPAFLVSAFKELQDKKGPWENDPVGKVLVEKVEYLVGHAAVDGEVTLRATAVCHDVKSAEEVKKLAEAGLVMLKTMKGTPREVVDTLDSAQLSMSGARIDGTLKVQSSPIAKVIEQEYKEAEEPTYMYRSLSRLTKDLESKDAAERKRAAQDLGQMGPEAGPAAPTLARLLKDPDQEVRRSAAMALGRIGPEARAAVPALVEATRSTDPREREQACRALGNVGAQTPEVVPALAQAVKDPVQDVRSAATLSLAHIGPDAAAAVPALIQAMKDPESKVGQWAALALGGIGPAAKEAVPVLVEAALRDATTEMPDMALRALPEIGTEAVPALLLALADPGATVRARAASALGGFGARAREAVPSLAKALEDSDAKVQQAAAAALGAIGPEAREALPQLIGALEKGNDHAISALGRIGPAAKPAVPALVRKLSGGSAYDQRWVMNALADIGPEAREAVPALREITKPELEPEGPDFKITGQRRVRFKSTAVTAWRTLWKIEGNADEAVTGLVDLIKQLESDKRDAVQVLGEIGPPAAKAVPALIDLVKTDEGWSDTLKEEAIDTLGKIGPAARESVPFLIELLRAKKSYSLPKKAATALGKIGADARAAVPALARALDGGYDTVGAAALALAHIGPEARKALPALDKLARKDIVSHRMPAAYALWKLDGQVDRPVQVAMVVLKHVEYHKEEKVLAARMLGEMAARARPAVQVLRLAQKDRDADVRRAASEALPRIEPRP